MDEQRPADPGSSSAARAPLPSRAGQAATAQPPVEVQRAAPGISVRGLEAYYGDNHAIKDVSIEYAANRVTAMIGPSGCGKSTVLRCLNRMHEEIPKARAEGKVLLDDADIYAPGVDVVAVRRAIGMVFQKPNPFPTMSIFDNVAAGLKLNGVKGVDLKERVEESLRGAGLWEEVKDRLDRPGIGLSGGQQQRLCIARTIAVQPAVILMDEPCSALDPIATLKVEELIEDLKARFTIIIVTHNMQQAARVADTTAFFLLGELIEHAPTEKVFTTPSDERTEQYVTGKFG
ncbi:phosphate ABC transporter ATP-binding protein [Baekduia soli]|uniref:Phosphate ABC transporter ATP-binding protein n=2 Tax=Baekduia soli TaxID=496014 RepID=A0A5B8UBY2_9ACTN|nr:phosphate ABC transporter ATP-binding protein [Baekduia soli]